MGSIYDWSLVPGDNATADDDINWSEGQFPSTVNDSARQMMGRLAELVKDLGGDLTVSGTNSLTVTANSGFTAYADGQMLAFRAANTNTGATTLNVNSIGAKSVRTNEDAALAGGEIAAGGIYLVRYNEAANSAAGAWILQNPTIFTYNPANDPEIDWGGLAFGNVNDVWSDGQYIQENAAPKMYLIDETASAYKSMIEQNSDSFWIRASTTGEGNNPSSFPSDASAQFELAFDEQILRLWGGEVLRADKAATLDNYGIGALHSGSVFRVAGPGATWNTGLFRASNTNGGSGTELLMRFDRNTDTAVGSIQSTNTTTAYNTSSDERLKDFIGAYDPLAAIAIIRADPVRDFNWKDGGEYAVGWGAQTSYAVSADLASPGNGEPGDDDFMPWSVDKGARTPYLWAAVSWLLDERDAMRAEMDDLKSRLAAIEAQLA